MALPASVVSILDNGLGVSQPATSVAAIIGVANSGATNSVQQIGSQRQLVSLFGVDGPLVEAAAYVLAQAGGPLLAVRATGDVAGTYNGAATAALASSSGGGTGNTVSLAIADGAPLNDYEVVLTVVTGGTSLATTFTYSLDGGSSQSSVVAVTPAATQQLGASGVRVLFGTGAGSPFVAGATYGVYAKAPMISAASLGTAMSALDATLIPYDFIHVAGNGGTAGQQATLAAALSSRIASQQASLSRFVGGMISAGDSAGATAGATAGQVSTAFANAVIDSRVSLSFGKVRTAAPIAIAGRAAPWLPASLASAMRAAGNLPSTDLAQTSGAQSVGALPGALAISHDEFLSPTGLDAQKITTLRTYPGGLQGFFLSNVWLHSAAGSDFQWWQHRRIMDLACSVVTLQHSLLISSSVVTKTDGTGAISEFSAQQIEKRVQRALDAVIGSAVRVIGPAAIDGTIGHVSDIRYQVDRQANVLSTSTLIATVSIVPRGYLKRLEAVLSFKLAV